MRIKQSQYPWSSNNHKGLIISAPHTAGKNARNSRLCRPTSVQELKQAFTAAGGKMCAPEQQQPNAELLSGRQTAAAER